MPEKQEIREQSCKSDKPVPINCVKFEADDSTQRLTFQIRQIDPISFNKTTFNIEGVPDCTSKSVKLYRGDYELIFDCKNDDWKNKDLNGTLSFDYTFLNNKLTAKISFVRIFGSYDPIYDRAPLSEDFT